MSFLTLLLSCSLIAGTCGRCGWPLDQNGQCTNKNCRQYGPDESD